MAKEVLINRLVLEKLYLHQKNPIRLIARLLSCGEATVLRYLRLYEIERRPQQQWKGKHLSEESKKKLSIAHTGKKLSEEHKQKLSEVRMGVTRNTPKRLTNKQGYILLWKPKHPMSNAVGYLLEHRFVMSEKLGRYIERDEIVHHLNSVKTDNRPENISLTDRSKHSRDHSMDSEERKRRSKMMKDMRKKRFWSTKKKVK